MCKIYTEEQKNRQLYRKIDRRVEKEINMKKKQMCKIYIEGQKNRQLYRKIDRRVEKQIVVQKNRQKGRKRDKYEKKIDV